MILVIEGILTPEETAAMREAASGMAFGDGRATAGRYAREVKANAQAEPSPGRDAVLEKVRRALAGHEVFAAAAQARRFAPLILSRYGPGQSYGLHVDDALMAGLRTDVSFTLFLSDPESYDGGGLMIEDGIETRALRPAAGSAVVYPSTSLHRVAPVTRGERLAVVGWAESWVRSAERREILFDLDRAIRTVHARDGKTELFDLLAKSRSNLLRQWAGG